MNRPHFSFLPLILTAFFLCIVTESAATQEVGLVTVDVKDVAKGYRANSLRLKPVMNDKKELIGTIDDFMFGRDDVCFRVSVYQSRARAREGWFRFHLLIFRPRYVRLRNKSDPVDFLRTAARLVRPSTSPEASILCPASGVGTRQGI